MHACLRARPSPSDPTADGSINDKTIFPETRNILVCHGYLSYCGPRISLPSYGIGWVQLSAERDQLVEENERSAARLHQLTTALQEQREEKARLANQARRLEDLPDSKEHSAKPSTRCLSSFALCRTMCSCCCCCCCCCCPRTEQHPHNETSSVWTVYQADTCLSAPRPPPLGTAMYVPATTPTPTTPTPTSPTNYNYQNNTDNSSRTVGGGWRRCERRATSRGPRWRGFRLRSEGG